MSAARVLLARAAEERRLAQVSANLGMREETLRHLAQADHLETEAYYAQVTS